jgi:glycosyltransferase involved in cell wall biosynthesis
MSKGNLTLIFNHFEFGIEHLGKDVFLIPYNLGKKLGYDVTIVYPRTSSNLDIPEILNGVRLIPIEYKNSISFIPFWRHINFYFYFFKHLSSINLLMRIHISLHTEIMTILFKKLNKKGKVYVKLDINPDGIELLYARNIISLKGIIHRWITAFFIKNVDCVSCETFLAYTRIKESNAAQLQFGEKLQLLPNGFDDELLSTLRINQLSFLEKENIIITVGRLGTPQKNTEMFLRALTEVKLKDWQVFLIGPIDSRLNKTIQDFFNENPSKIKSVKFLGPIYDKRELWEYYNRSKVFVLTSNWEGFPIVFPEAKFFRNYIISTEVAACHDIIENEKYGISIPLNNHKRLAKVLNEIVSNERNIDVYDNYCSNQLSWEFQINKLNL